MPLIYLGTAAEIIDILRGPRPAAQYDEHCKGWRWELYLHSARRASAAVNAEVRRMIAQKNATEFQQAAAE